jgi:cytidylate kinase
MTQPRERDVPAADAAIVVAIDGPSGSGKSSVARAVARRLGLSYLDTGAMYRALTWWCRERGIDLADSAAVARAARELPLEMGVDPAAPSVTVGGTPVDAAIREAGISASVSAVATNLDVRTELVRRQRDLIAEARSQAGGVVAEGRDITTVVAPEAEVRILLIADEAARLARRATEVHGQADSSAVAAVHDLVVRRDRDDSSVAQFHQAADGVVTVDTSALDLQQSIEAVLSVVGANAVSR